jgi:hypothetical protein
LAGGVQRVVDGVGPLGQRAADAAQLPVGVERQTAVPAALEKFAEGVLQQRQRAGLLVDVGHQRGYQFRLDGYADPRRRPLDGPHELVGRHGDDHLGALLHHLAQAGVKQRPVIEVGPQGGNDAQGAARVADGGDEGR